MSGLGKLREPLIDSHAHLSFANFQDDRDGVLLQARKAGLVAIVNVGSGGRARAFDLALPLAVENNWI